MILLSTHLFFHWSIPLIEFVDWRQWYFRPGADVVCVDGSVAVAGGGGGAAGLLPPQHQQSKHCHSSSGKCSCKEMQYCLHYSYLPVNCPGIFLICTVFSQTNYMKCVKIKKQLTFILCPFLLQSIKRGTGLQFLTLLIHIFQTGVAIFLLYMLAKSRQKNRGYLYCTVYRLTIQKYKAKTAITSTNILWQHWENYCTSKCTFQKILYGGSI